MNCGNNASIKFRSPMQRRSVAHSLRWVAIAAVAISTPACDPLNPRLTGEVVLPAGALPTEAVVELRGGVAVGAFEQGTEPIPDVHASAREDYRKSLPLKPGQHRVPFTLGAGIGSSQSKHWRVVAWVSSDAATGLQHSSFVGHADIELPPKCGPFGMHGYCHGVDGIRIVLSEVR